MELTAADIVHATGGALHPGVPDARASSFAIDSRLVGPGACFVALRAVRDGHDYVADAARSGATIAIVEHAVENAPTQLAQVLVEDGMDALAALARDARARLAQASVVGITGSAGKTATKDLTAAALGVSRRVHASPQSFNNEAGVPLTLLGAPLDVDVVVVEMGARFPGNIAELVELSRPDVGVVTHVGMAHAGHLGGRVGIAQVKGELVDGLSPAGLAVLNADCDASAGLAARTRARVLRVGRATGADVVISHLTLDDELRPRFVLDTPWGRAPIALALRGEHQAENAAMAVAVAGALDVSFDDAVAGVSAATTASRRMELLHTADGVLVINDAYNSSPTSAAAAVRSLARLPVSGRRVAVLGEMLELGSHADAEHVAIGALAGASGIDLLIAVGEHASLLARGAEGTATAVVIVADAAAASELVVSSTGAGDAVLVKASRAVGLDCVADALVQGRAS